MGRMYMYTYMRWLKNVVRLWALSVNLLAQVTPQVSMKKEIKRIERFECLCFLPGCLAGPEAHQGLLIIYRGDINDGRVWLFCRYY